MLHVANGTSTTRSIEASGLPGVCSIWADPLHDGPVPGGLDDAQLLEVRARHLAGDYPDHGDPANDLRQWRAAIETVNREEEVVLWYEHDLFDQLNLIQLLPWISDRLPPATRVSLVCIGSFPGRPHFKGIGELNAADLPGLFAARQPVTGAQYALARTAWEAFRQPTPQPLDTLRRSDTSAMPYLATALRRFLEEYPWTGDGLSRTERRFLQLAADGPVTLFDIFPRMHDGEDSYYVTDSTLVEMAESLSAPATPLVTTTPSRTARPMDRRVALTDAGRAVLSGHADRIALCGIDRWFGGVHLSGATPWRWDGSSVVR